MDFIINAAVTFVTVAFTLVAVLAIVRWRDRRAERKRVQIDVAAPWAEFAEAVNRATKNRRTVADRTKRAVRR